MMLPEIRYFNSTSLGDEALAAQWRHCVLDLSRSLTLAANSRPGLAVILLEAFDHALEQLLLFGRQEDLQALEVWLAEQF